MHRPERGNGPIGPLTITVRRLDGSLVESSDVSALSPGQTTRLLTDGAQIANTSGVSYVVEGKGISKRTPVSLCRLPAATDECTAAVQAP